MVPFLGFGVGLRTQHYDTILRRWPKVDWFEVISENYMVDGGRPLWILDQIAERYPVVMHGVSLSLGSTDPLNRDYLRRLKNLARRVKPVWISDHLCWTGVGGKNIHDLLPLPYTEASLKHVVSRIRQAQDILERSIVIENVSSYMSFTSSTMPEWKFLNAVAREADCAILLDLNNIYVSAHNHTFDPKNYLAGIDTDRVAQFHLAGHSNRGRFLLDTHDHPIAAPVWDLYRKALQRFGSVSTLIEWDDHIPRFRVLQAAAERAKAIYRDNCEIQTNSAQKNSARSLEAHQLS